MYKYTHFIKENIAPVEAKYIKSSSSKANVAKFGLGELSSGLTESERLYRFEALSDIHISDDPTNYKSSYSDFENALEYAKAANCVFICISGDLTDTAAGDIGKLRLEKYNQIREDIKLDDGSTFKIYEIAGNHENNSVGGDVNLAKYIGKPLYYTVTSIPDADDPSHNYVDANIPSTDVFIMVGHYGGYVGDGIGWRSSEFISTAELTWIHKTLDKFRDKRCFVFNHAFPNYSYVEGESVGDPKGLYNGALWNPHDSHIGTAFVKLLVYYENVILFHGHSHTRLHLQDVTKIANYSDKYGYKSVHIPSTAVPRDIGLNEKGEETLTVIQGASEGYIVDVYPTCIVLNGVDFGMLDMSTYKREPSAQLGIATYKIDTPIRDDIPSAFLKDIIGETVYKNIYG